MNDCISMFIVKNKASGCYFGELINFSMQNAIAAAVIYASANHLLTDELSFL